MTIQTEVDYSSPDWLLAGMVEGIAARAAGVAPPEHARKFYSASLAALAHAAMVARGVDPPGVSPRVTPGRCIELALTTSDFPGLAGNVFSKVLLDGYATAAPSYRSIAREIPIPDFKETSAVAAGDFPAPQPVGDGGEVKTGRHVERHETLRAETHAVRTPLSLALLVNDDAAGLAASAAAARDQLLAFENAIALETCLLANSGLGQTLLDTNPLFHASRSNIATSGALDAAKLSELRSLVKAATTPAGVRLNLDADIILTSPASQGLAEALAAALAPVARLRVLADSNLTGTRLYAFASGNPPIGYGYVAGNGPNVVSQASWGTMGLDVRTTLHFAVGVVNALGSATAAGA
ncbi:MAG: hypothetical protein M5U32_11535 [Myxococcota bacterium]|nr:hypothetical protein [Myxococcota bacterium]